MTAQWFLVATNHTAADGPAAAYSFELRPGPAMAVTLEFYGDASGTTQLEVQQNWGGVENDGSDIHQLEIRAANGQALEYLHPRPYAWQVTHPRGEKLQVRYVIPVTPERGKSMHGNDYRTRLNDELFQMHGNLGLLFPMHLEASDPQDWSVQFRGFEEHGWQVVSSFGYGSELLLPRLSSDRFRQSLFMAGKIRLHERNIGGNRICVAIHGSDWGFADDQFVALAERIIRAERDFFDDHSDPWFLITLTPEGDTSRGGVSLGGTGVTNAFALYCTTGLSLAADSQYAPRLALLLAHEYFHTWNGIKIPTAEGEGDTYWFSEGFTNFFARRIVHQIGLLSDSQFATNLSEAVASYDSNPFRQAPNQNIRESFWSNANLGQLPYQRGDLVACLLDEHLRKKSNGQQTLDDFIRALLQEHTSTKKYTTENLLNFIAKWADAEVAAQIRRIVLDGESVPLPDETSTPKLRLAAGKIQTFDPGLDVAASEKSGHVAGVREDGAAFSAGLRNGQPLLGFSFIQGNPPKAKVDVRDGEETRSIEYLAVGDPKDVRVYRVVE